MTITCNEVLEVGAGVTSAGDSDMVGSPSGYTLDSGSAYHDLQMTTHFSSHLPETTVGGDLIAVTETTVNYDGELCPPTGTVVENANNFVPNVNMASGKWSVDISYTLSPGSSPFYLKGISVTGVVSNLSGDFLSLEWRDEITTKYTVYIIDAATNETIAFGSGSKTVDDFDCQVAYSTTVRFDKDANGSYPLQSGNFIVRIEADQTTSWDALMGMQTITFIGQTCPEPTTATLTLLALTGLAARRRRR